VRRSSFSLSDHDFGCSIIILAAQIIISAAQIVILAARS
jgi:hypothetical protein